MLTIRNAVFPVSPHKKLTITDFQLQPGECCAVVGNNGGKTMMARALAQELEAESGEYACNLRPELVSFEKQLKLYDDEWQRINTDMLGAEEEIAATAAAIIQQHRHDDVYCQELAQQFGISHLLEQPLYRLIQRRRSQGPAGAGIDVKTSVADSG